MVDIDLTGYNRKEWKDYDDPLQAFCIFQRLDETKEYGCNCDESPNYWYDPDMNEYYEIQLSEANLLPTFEDETYLDEFGKRRCIHCNEIITNLIGIIQQEYTKFEIGIRHIGPLHVNDSFTNHEIDCGELYIVISIENKYNEDFESELREIEDKDNYDVFEEIEKVIKKYNKYILNENYRFISIHV